MFTRSTIKTAASSLVGWRSTNHTAYSALYSHLKTSESGLYVNDLPGVDLDIVSDSIKDKTVKDYLNDVHDTAALTVIQKFVQNTKSELNTKELLSNTAVFPHRCEWYDKIAKISGFKGYMITPKPSKGIKASVDSVAFYSDAAISLTLYMFELSQKAAVKTVSYSNAAGGTLTWQTLSGWNVSFEGDYGDGQSYLIGYFEDDLGSASLYEEEWRTGNLTRNMNKFVDVTPVGVTSSYLDGANRPAGQVLDSADISTMPGFNLRMNVKCDITRVLEKNIDMFSEAIQYEIAVRILEDAITSQRLNATVTKAKTDSWREFLADYRGKLYGGYLSIEGSPTYKKGLIENLTMDFSELDDVCLPPKPGSISKGQWQI